MASALLLFRHAVPEEIGEPGDWPGRSGGTLKPELEMNVGICRSAVLFALAVVFTVGLTFATLELPYYLDGVLQAALHTPDLDSHVDTVSRLKTELFMAHYHVRAVGYVCFFLLMGLIVAGFSTRKTGLARLGAVGVMLAVFAQFAGVMFFLAGLGVLNAIWLPVLDISYELQNWGRVIEAPNDLIHWTLGIFGIRSPWPTIVFFTASGILIFLLGVYAWLTARARGKGIADFWLYRISRHPQYLGWILWTYGAFLLIQLLRYPKRSWGIGASLPWLISTMVIIGVALLEELNMRRRHGENYEAYRNSAPFLFPLPRVVDGFFSKPFRLLFGKEHPSRPGEIVALVGGWTVLLMAISAFFYAGGIDATRARFVSEEERGAMVEALARQLSQESDHRERYDLVMQLAALGEPAVGPLMALFEEEDPSLRSLAAEALERLGSDAAVPALCSALADSVEGVRYRAALALEVMESKRSIGCLLRTMQDSEADFPSQALRTLANLGVEDVLTLSEPLLSDEYHRTRADGASALGALGSEAALPLLQPMLHDQDPRVRREAVIALLRIGSSRARPWLEQARSDNDFEVRVYSAEALKRLPRG